MESICSTFDANTSNTFYYFDPDQVIRIVAVDIDNEASPQWAAGIDGTADSATRHAQPLPPTSHLLKKQSAVRVAK